MSGGRGELAHNVEDMTVQELYSKLVVHTTEQTELLKQEISTSISGVSLSVSQSQQEVKLLQNRCLLLERNLRRNNVVIFGMNLITDNLLHETLKTLNRYLKTSFVASDINNIRRIGKGQQTPVVLEFVSYLRKRSVFENVKNLKGTGISVGNDLCKEDRESNKVLVQYLKKAKAENIKAYIKGGKLMIDGKAYTVAELQNVKEGEFVSESEEGECDGEAPAAVFPSSVTQSPRGNSTDRVRRKVLRPSPPKNAITTRSRK